MAACPSCEARDFEQLLSPRELAREAEWLKSFYAARLDDDSTTKDRTDFAQADLTSIDVCLACGTVLRNPRPSEDELRGRYEHDEYGQETLEAIARSSDQFFRAKVQGLRDSLRPGAMILEVGSFAGSFLAAAADEGWQAVGVDIGKETSEFCRARGLNVLRGTIFCEDLSPGSWDAIVVWNTFDQLDEPRRFLQRARQLLAPDGLLVLRFPNGKFESICVRHRAAGASPARAHRILLAQAYENFLTFPYLAGYNADSISMLLEATGFGVQTLVGDTIQPLATPKTKPYAVREERAVKRATIRACTLAARAGLVVFPWLDVHARPAPQV